MAGMCRRMRVRRNTGVREHAGENIAIEHALHGHAFGGGFDAGGAADGVDQGLAMMGTRAAQQGSVDIEKHQGSLGGSFTVQYFMISGC